jgi:TRAP-type mannitol/chloroaromatic compound transport system substrate-binding protein
MNNLEDLRKLKFRSSGIGLEMFRRMGVSTVGMAGGDIVPSLERGVIDGAEWAIPEPRHSHRLPASGPSSTTCRASGSRPPSTS